MASRLIYRAGEWEIDLSRRELRLRQVPVAIGGRAFEIIEVLVESAGQVVSKRVLAARVWPGHAIEDNTLQVHISALRKALGADRGLLETASGRGYRLLGDWTIWSEFPSRDEFAQSISAPTQVPGHLPLAMSELIGRDIAVRQLRELMFVHRIVTLTGPGGIGKTRLALEVARLVASNFDGDVTVIELTAVSDPRLVPPLVAGVLGLQTGVGAVSANSVARAIGNRRLLLVLDNCEHVIDAAAALAEMILQNCPFASVLATSREALRLDGEFDFGVPPLDVPPPGEESPAVLDHGAVRLFVASTRVLDAAFTPDAENLRALAAICRRLDGIPLAIELAAARATTLALDQILSRLDDRFRLLTGGRRTALPRQQTLRATLDWSHDLLAEAERRLFRRLAVFAPGFTLDAAATIIADNDEAVPAAEDGIANLVAKSLVVSDGPRSEGRWRLLETTRAYALEKLIASGEGEQVQRHHAAYFRDLITSAPDVTATGQLVLRHGREIDNVRAALDWAFAKENDIETGVVLTAAYGPVWMDLSLMAECRERTERAFAGLQRAPHMDPRLRMQLHFTLGLALLHTTGSIERTEAILSGALVLAEELDDANAQLRALWAMWTCRINAADHVAARPLGERFKRVARRTGEPADMLVADRLEGNALHYRGNQPEARRHFLLVQEDYVAPAGGRHAQSFLHEQRLLARARLARVLWLQGFLDQARLIAHACLQAALERDRKFELCLIHAEVVAPIAVTLGDLAAAEASLAWLTETATRQSMTLWIQYARCLEATLLIRQGKLEQGIALARPALRTFSESGQTVHYLGYVGDFVEALAAIGRHEEAIYMIDDVLARHDRDGELWCAAELRRVKGVVLLDDTDRQSHAAAESCFVSAIELAKQQGALFWEVRAALSLARLRLSQMRPDEARAVLEPVYANFSEGFESLDLRTARALLDRSMKYPTLISESKEFSTERQ